jgi:sugar phosphate isomerase/epimerase
MYGNLPLATVLEEVRGTGTQELDLWAKIHGTQHAEAETLGRETLLARLKEHGVSVPFTTRYDLGPFQLTDEINFVRDLGGRAIVTGAKGPAKLAGTALRDTVQHFVELLKPPLAQAEMAGLRILVENHTDTLIESADSLLWLAEFGQGLPLGIALAPYHLPQDPALIARLIQSMAGKLSLFYGWQYGRGCMKPMPKTEELKQLPGRGTLDFSLILRALRKINYTGWTEILMHPTPRGLPILETAGAVTAEINRAQGYLNRLIAQLD